MTTNNVTANRGYSLPFSTNLLDEDVLRLIAALNALDTDVAQLFTQVNLKAPNVHGHVINDVAGLQAALDSKLGSGTSFTLGALTDVNVADAQSGMFLRNSNGSWIPVTFDAAMIASGVIAAARLPSHLTTTALSAAYAAVVHGHAISDVVGLQGALDGKTSFPSGTRLLFQQTTAPVGWTKDTTQNDKALRVVSGAVGSGGSVAFSTAFANRTVSGNVADTTAGGTIGGTALTEGQMPAHNHSMTFQRGDMNLSGSGAPFQNVATTGYAVTGTTTTKGNNETHTHSFTGAAHNHSFSTTLNMAVAYVDIIIAQKD